MNKEIIDYVVRPYRKGEEEYVADAHRRIYSGEYRWGESFTKYAAQIALDYANTPHSDREELWIAEAEGKPVGYIMLCETEDPSVGQLRLFLVEKEYRRFGIGRALTNALMDRVKESGYSELMLWTAGPLKDAIRHYEKLGFHVVEETENLDWSLDGEPVTEIKMTKDLRL